MPTPPKETTQISKVELPQWVDQASQQNYIEATKLAKRPYVENPYDRVQPLNPLYQRAIDTFNAGVGKSSNMLTDAAKGLPGMDRSAYTNPFTNEVIDRSLADFGRARDIELNDNASRATASKAFGGSRASIIDAVTRAETARKFGDLSAGLRREGYDNATAAMTSDLNRIPAIAGALDESRMRDFGGMFAGADKLQSNLQGQYDAAARRFAEKRNAPLEGLNLKLSALGMSPYGKTEEIKKTEKTGTDFASIGGGILSLLPALFMLSDRTTKTDIEPVGTEPATGLPFFSYRYKGTPSDSPKIIGPMAQDVRKLFPERVRRVNGKLAVQMS